MANFNTSFTILSIPENAGIRSKREPPEFRGALGISGSELIRQADQTARLVLTIRIITVITRTAPIPTIVHSR